MLIADKTAEVLPTSASVSSAATSFHSTHPGKPLRAQSTLGSPTAMVPHSPGPGALTGQRLSSNKSFTDAVIAEQIGYKPGTLFGPLHHTSGSTAE